jgi:hypothetical protein
MKFCANHPIRSLPCPEEQVNQELSFRKQEYDRCRATGCIWERGMPLDQLNPSLREFVEHLQTENLLHCQEKFSVDNLKSGKV